MTMMKIACLVRELTSRNARFSSHERLRGVRQPITSVLLSKGSNRRVEQSQRCHIWGPESTTPNLTHQGKGPARQKLLGLHRSNRGGKRHLLSRKLQETTICSCQRQAQFQSKQKVGKRIHEKKRIETEFSGRRSAGSQPIRVRVKPLVLATTRQPATLIC